MIALPHVRSACIVAALAVLPLSAAADPPLQPQATAAPGTTFTPSDASPAPQPSAGASASAGWQDAAFAAIAKRFFYDGFREQPSGATSTGVHTYDTQLDDLSAAAFARRLAREAGVLRAVRALDGARLSPDVALDRTLLENQILDDELLTGELAQWRHNPDLYISTASGALYSLIERNFAPARTRLAAAIARERQIPRLLSQARANLGTVDAATKSVAVMDADGAASFIGDDVPAAFAGTGNAAERAAFRTSTTSAKAAMLSYGAYVRAIRPRGTYAIGAAAYRRRLVYEDALDVSVADYLRIGTTALAHDRARFIATAHAIAPGAPVLATYAGLARRHPTPQHLLSAAAGDLQALRAFVISHHIVTLPPDADISVTATPKFQRSFVTAQEDAPGVLERVATKTYYNVTPPDASWPSRRQDEYLGQLNDFQRPLISGHEVYPGHFVNYVIDKHLDLSLTRRLSGNSEFAEGWAHYGEQMMVDEGYGGSDPRRRLAQLSEALLRECRFVVGVKLHTAGWTLAQGERYFQTACFQSSAVAAEETLRGTQDPMYGYYTLGKLMILKLRDDYRRKLGAEYTLQRFHDALLAHGDPPVPLVRPLLLGADDDGKPL